MNDVAIASAAAVLVVVALVVFVLVARRRRRRSERHRKTMVIQVALPFVPTPQAQIATMPPPRPTRRPSHTPPPPDPTEALSTPPVSTMLAPIDDDGPTAVDPRYASVMAIEGPTQRGAAVPPARPEPLRVRDANVRAAIRANTLQATFKPKR